MNRLVLCWMRLDVCVRPYLVLCLVSDACDLLSAFLLTNISSFLSLSDDLSDFELVVSLCFCFNEQVQHFKCV